MYLKRLLKQKSMLKINNNLNFKEIVKILIMDASHIKWEKLKNGK